MTYDEAMKVLAILKGAYPNSYRGVTVEEAKLTATVWASQFSNMPVKIVMIAVNKLISTSTFPPSIKEVKDKISALYFECENLLQAHRYATVGVKMYADDPTPLKTGKPLPDKVLTEIKEILKIVEPFRGRDNEPSMASILNSDNGYFIGNNSAERKRLE